MSCIRAVLFDLDGTLFDSERVYRDGFLRAAEQLGLPRETVDHHAHLCGLPRNESRVYMKSVFGADFPYDAWREKMWEYAASVFSAGGPPVKPYAKETLTALREMGLSVAVATSSRAEIALPYLEKTGLLPLLDTAVTGERVARGKPFPDIFLLAARELDLPAKACAVVEDAKNGILAAHRAGCYPILVPDLYPPAEELLPLLWHRAGSLREIPALVRAHNEGRE